MALVTHLLIVNSHHHVTFRLLGLLILFAVSLSVHNKQVLADDSAAGCTFAKYPAGSELSLSQAKAKLAPLIGKKYTSNDGLLWQYEIGICTQVGSIAGAAVLQKKMENGSAKESRKIGSLDDTHIYVGTDWIMLEYRKGETCNEHSNKEDKRSVVMITCDPDADDTSKIIFMEEENDKTEQCYYLFEMKHKAVCPVISDSYSLSVGTILIIVFVSVVAVYLLVGFAYSRFVLGAKGIEQIPNYEFWKDFGNLQSDGCDFVCRSKGRSRSNKFGGIGDDQLETAEEIQDDYLLPM